MFQLYGQLVVNPPKKTSEEEKIEPISNCLLLNSVDSEERQKLSKLGFDIISKGRRKNCHSQNFQTAFCY